MSASGIRILEKIVEDIDIISFDDREAWDALCVQMEALIGDLPDKSQRVSVLLRTCLDALQIISRREATDILSYIEAASGAVNAALFHLQQNPESDRLIGKAQENLDRLFQGADEESHSGCAADRPNFETHARSSLAELSERLAQDEQQEAGLTIALQNFFNAIKKINGDLEGLIRKGHQDPGLIKILDLCRKVLEILPHRPVGEVKCLLAKVSRALDSAEQLYCTGADQDHLVGEAIMCLEAALACKIKGLEPVANLSLQDAPKSDFSLHDAAAILIQLEPDDLSGMTDLQQMLIQIARHMSTGQSAREYINQAIGQIETVFKAGASDPEGILGEVGKLVEAAMNAVEEDAETHGEMPFGALPVADRSEIGDAMQPDEPGANQQAVCSSLIPSQKTAVQSVSNDPAFDYMPQDIDPELFAEFIAECNELIAAAEEALLSLEANPDDTEAVGTVFRAFHTIKGTAGFTDLTLISDLGHHAESLLSRVRDGAIRYGGEYADLALRALDMMKTLISSVQIALEGRPLHKPEGYDDLMSILASPEDPVATHTQFAASPTRWDHHSAAREKVEEAKLAKAAGPGVKDRTGATAVESDFADTADDDRAAGTQQRPPVARNAVESAIRVNTNRLDRLIDMVGELVIAHSMVAQDAGIAGNGHHELAKKINQTSKIVRELQDLSMSMRMVPLKATFKKMARLVRDSARKLGKQIEFITDGDDTEIDRNLVDVISDPLMHMVRNAVDHGIESPKDRENAGKPACGTIALSAYHAAGRVVVEIKDDGRGLDREKIISKAAKQGIIDEGYQPKEREVFNLIFEPGFSTAQTVTAISGRGVGMDVVKKNIEKLRGQVEINSESGRGSVFKMSLPLTLAIIDGMVIRVRHEMYIIPTASIISSIQPYPADISTLLHRGEMLSFHGKLLPLFSLDSIFDMPDAEQDPAQRLVVVIEDEAYQAGLCVDELVGRQQVVIKSLGDTMQNIPGISGGAILPNGRVGLILDIGGLLRFAHSGYDEKFNSAGI